MFKKFAILVFLFALLLLVAAMPAPALTAKAISSTATPPGADGPDRPTDGPDGQAASGPRTAPLAAASAGQTIVVYELPNITFTVSDGYDLDQYLYRSSSPIDFDIDMQGTRLAAGDIAILTLRVWDVDQDGASGIVPEVDKVYVNNTYLGNLTGANSQWSTVPFIVPASALNPGANHFRVDVDTLSTSDTWAVEVDWAELKIGQTIVQTEAWAYDDVTIRRGTSDNYIGKTSDLSSDVRIWEIAYPGVNDPIADKMTTTGVSYTPPQFRYRYVLGPASQSNWTPRVDYSWEIKGTSQHGLGTLNGWDNQFPITLPSKIGKYALAVTLKVFDSSGSLITTLPRNHTLYVVLDEPRNSGNYTKDGLDYLPGGGRYPRTAWLDRAMEWAGGQTTFVGALQKLNENEYALGSSLGWKYGYANDKSTTLAGNAFQLIEIEQGKALFGDCFTFRDAWRLLADSLGIPVEAAKYSAPNADGFLTEVKEALDSNSYNTLAKDRWVFVKHALGRYRDDNNLVRLYDPTFGLISDPYEESEESELAAMEANVYCRGKDGAPVGSPPPGWFQHQPCVVLPGRTPPGPDTAFLNSLGYSNAWGWGVYDYTLPTSQAPMPALPGLALVDLRNSSTTGGITLAGVPLDHGIDPDGNGLFEWLQVDVPVNTAQADEYFFDAWLLSGDGQQVVERMYALSTDRERQQPLRHAQLGAGAQTVPLYFDGNAIRATGIAGPYTLWVSLYDAGGLSDSGDFPTQAYTANQFQGLLIEDLSLSDRGIDADGVPGYESLRLSVQFNMIAAGTVSGQATLFGNGMRLATLDLPATQHAAGVQTLGIDFPGESIYASRVDGPYTVQVDLRDQYFSADGQAHATTAYAHSQFQTPNASFTGNTQDAGSDLNSDGVYDELTILTEVTARVAGTYRVNAILEDSTSQSIEAISSTADLDGSLPQTVTLHFSGLKIGRNGVDGPYRVLMGIEDSHDVELDGIAYGTAAYPVTAFQQPGARLNGTITDSGIDTDGDGGYNLLRVSVGVDVALEGTYRLSAGLHDAEGNFIAVGQTPEIYLTAGAQTVDLDFSGSAIRSHKVDGPYQLVGLDLQQAGVGLVDYRLDGYLTAAYPYTVFRPSGPMLLGEFNDQGLDTNGNGLYEKLVVNMKVSITQTATYYFNARLVDANGNELTWASGSQYLTVGEQWIALQFDGRYLSGNQANGPYQLQAFTLYSDTQTLTEFAPYTTGAYDWRMFESSATISGTVSSGGQPAANANVFISGVDSDVTDASGRYTLAVLNAGTYTITISADPALEPWQIWVNGQLTTTGASASLQVALGAQIEVNFVSVPGLSTETPTPTPTETPTPTPTETLTPTLTPTPTPIVLRAPRLIHPFDGLQTYYTRALFLWHPVRFGASYQLQIDNNADFSSPERDVTLEQTHYRTVLPVGRYYWRVQAISEAGVAGPWSHTYTFTIRRHRPHIRGR